MASKKANIKRVKQQITTTSGTTTQTATALNERKVKSVMRGSKVNNLHSSSAQKHASPPPKRFRAG